MKALIVFGAIVGFVIGAVSGLSAGSPWSSMIWRACATALAAAILTRWWSHAWLRGLRESIQQHHTARISKPATKA